MRCIKRLSQSSYTTKFLKNGLVFWAILYLHLLANT